MSQFDIDLVYLWVDGNDIKWLSKKNAFLGNNQENVTDATTIARFIDNDELKYSLRSVEKYAPWVRKIFILTNEQRPHWLNTENNKIEIVDLSEILPPEAFPCFNSVIIEHFLYKIPGLADRFLLSNDDMFLNRHVTPATFFTDEGYPIVRLKYVFLGKWIMRLKKTLNIHTNNYRKTIDRSAMLIEKKFGKYYSDIPHHNIDSYLKADYRRVVEEYFKDEILSTVSHHIRTDDDIQRVIFSYFALVQKHAKLKYVGRSESCHIRVQKKNYNRYIDLNNPIFFCLNDTIHVKEEDRKRIAPFLNGLFPEKSSFEK